MTDADPTGHDQDPGRREGAGAAGGLFALSVVVLTFEILQTRLFSYCLPPILVFCAVGVAFLGLGASGTLLSVWSGWRRAPLGVVGALACAGFAITLVATSSLFAHVSADMAGFGRGYGQYLVLAALAVPYVFAGVAITASLSEAAEGVHRAYRVNLLGSALGCFTVFFALRPLGAPVLLGVLALAATLAGALYLGRHPSGIARAAVGLAALVSIGAIAFSDRCFPLQPEPSGQLTLIEKRFRAFGWEDEPELLYGSWDPTGRIEVHSFSGDWGVAHVTEPVPVYFYSQDGSAGSILFGVGDDLSRMRGFFERTLYGTSYAFRDQRGEKVCIIGLGGGPDVQAAHWFGAASIDGVDINQSAIDSVAGPFAEFTGDPYGREDVHLHRMDGRTFMRSTEETFDLVVMSGVDTKSIHSAGSLAISENTLYTVEAMDEYLDRLAPGGTLAVLRFGNVDRLRLTAIAVEALRARGVEDPSKHFAVLEQNAWGLLLISAEPHPRERLERLDEWVAAIPQNTGIRIPMYDVLIRFQLGQAPRVVYSPLRTPEPDPERDVDVDSYFVALAAGTEDAFLDSIDREVSPTTDDRPFFFDRQKRSKVFTEPETHYRVMGLFLAILTGLAALFVLLPIPLFGAKGSRGGFGLLRTLLYFAAIGLGFMLLEIGLVQKFVLFLGHQSYSLMVVFASILVGAGMGSAWAGGRATAGAALVRRLAVPAIFVLAFVAVGFIELASVHAATFALPLRIAISALVLLPLGFALGMPFPTGLATVRRGAAALVPWAIGANGFASVLGSSLALPGAMLLGYRAIFVAGLVLYAVAALAAPRETRD